LFGNGSILVVVDLTFLVRGRKRGIVVTAAASTVD